MESSTDASPWFCDYHVSGELLRDLVSLNGSAKSRISVHIRVIGREWDVLAALADGLSTREIGRRLHLKQSGVRAHISAVVRELGVADREEAIAFFRETTST